VAHDRLEVFLQEPLLDQVRSAPELFPAEEVSPGGGYEEVEGPSMNKVPRFMRIGCVLGGYPGRK
jgi:hypothetical protein